MSKHWFPRTSAFLLLLVQLPYVQVQNNTTRVSNTRTAVVILPDLTAGHGDAATKDEEYSISLKYDTLGVSRVPHTAPPSELVQALLTWSSCRLILRKAAAQQFLGVFIFGNQTRAHPIVSLSPSLRPYARPSVSSLPRQVCAVAEASAVPVVEPTQGTSLLLLDEPNSHRRGLITTTAGRSEMHRDALRPHELVYHHVRKCNNRLSINVMIKRFLHLQI